MITVKELLEFSIENEFMMVAHATFWAVSNGIVSLADDSNKLKQSDIDRLAVEQMMQQNILGIGTVKLFVITCKNNWYAFYFAKTSLEAATLHTQLYGQRVEKIIEAQRLLHSTAHFVETGQEMFLIDYRKQAFVLPFYIGHSKAGELIMYKFNREARKVV